MKTAYDPFYAGKRVRIAYTVLLLTGLFLLSAALACRMTLPVRLNQTLGQMEEALPYASPDCILLAPGTPFSDDERTALSAIGTVTERRCADLVPKGLETDFRCRVIGMELTDLPGAVHLTDGRMPQNETECVLVLCRKAPGFEGLAATGTLLCIPEDPEHASYAVTGLTVVGIGENLLSAAAPLQKDSCDILLYTAKEAFLQDPANETTELLLTDTADREQARQKAAVIGEAFRDARNEALAARLAEEHAAKEAEAAAGAQAVRAQESRILQLKNHLETDRLRIEETKEALLALDDALQSEIQQFNAEMEIYEYYATNQVTLIGRKNLKEESFSKKRTEIEALRTALSDLYTAQTYRKAELRQEEDALAVLQAGAEEAGRRLHAPAAYTEAAPYTVLPGTDEALKNTMYETIRRPLRKNILPELLLFAGVTLLLLLLPEVCRFDRKNMLLRIISCLPVCIAGALLGALPFPAFWYRTVLPSFAEQHALTLNLLMPAAAALLLCAWCFLLPFVRTMLLRKQNAGDDTSPAEETPPAL